VTSNRKLVCYDPAIMDTPKCPSGRIALQVNTSRENSALAIDYYNWLGICEIIDVNKVYKEDILHNGLYNELITCLTTFKITMLVPLP